DGTDSVGSSYERQVGLAVADSDGVVADGALEENLLVVDPSRPFGRRLDHDEVMRHVEARWNGPANQLLVVEASDLARTLRYRPMVDGARFREMWESALAETDELVGRLLALVDLDADHVLVVAPYNLRGDRDLTVSAL